MNVRTRSFAGLIVVAAFVAAVAGASIACGSGGGAGDVAEDGFSDTDAAATGEFAAVDQSRAGALEAPPLAARGEHPQSDDGAAPAGEALQGLLDRKIVQSSSIDLEVEEVGRNFQEIIRVAETNGGFVASSSFSNVDGQQVADLTVRVPADRYQDVLARLRQLGDVTLESSDASDVTEEYTDLQARLRTLEATERRYLELLARAETIEEVLLVQDRLDGVRGQIEQVQGRINLLDHLTDLATITVHLRPVALGAQTTGGDGGPRPLEAAANAWERSLDALRGLAVAALVVGAFSWWLVPPLLALAVGARWWLSRHPGATGTA